MKRGGPLKRRTPLRPRRPEKRRREDVQAEAWVDGHSVPWAEVRQIIWVRCGGRCEVCDQALTFQAMEAHHRRTRAVGPNCPCNAIALCGHCHHVKVHGRPLKARELGRIISRHDRNTPAVQPVRLRYGTVLLACDGTFIRPVPDTGSGDAG